MKHRAAVLVVALAALLAACRTNVRVIEHVGGVPLRVGFGWDVATLRANRPSVWYEAYMGWEERIDFGEAYLVVYDFGESPTESINEAGNLVRLTIVGRPGMPPDSIEAFARLFALPAPGDRTRICHGAPATSGPEATVWYRWVTDDDLRLSLGLRIVSVDGKLTLVGNPIGEISLVHEAYKDVTSATLPCPFAVDSIDALLP